MALAQDVLSQDIQVVAEQELVLAASPVPEAVIAEQRNSKVAESTMGMCYHDTRLLHNTPEQGLPLPSQWYRMREQLSELG